MQVQAKNSFGGIAFFAAVQYNGYAYRLKFLSEPVKPCSFLHRKKFLVFVLHYAQTERVYIIENQKGGSEMTDQELQHLMKTSPKTVHRAFFDEYFNYVYTIVFSRLRSVGSPEDVDECVGDVFSELFVYFDRKEIRGGDLRGIVGTIAKQRSIDAYRRLSHRSGKTVPLEESGVHKMSDGTDVAESTEKKDMRRILLDRIGELGEPDSTIIIQKYYYSRTSNEIASMLKMKAEAVRMRSSRALKRLRNMLEKEGITL